MTKSHVTCYQQKLSIRSLPNRVMPDAGTVTAN